MTPSDGNAQERKPILVIGGTGKTVAATGIWAG
ncbi:hypothetical protein E9232_004205 [Inquilinus ginsengisoli]|jgi:hypothetical protein|uniref:Uncharacterized protein n=1 Tax=Inquilinus ginsengisoli TaxID=363840 RepID=A0ABU1JSS1_9PROT|nr:hypothetical protein [Inquilinus ginsengisoli]